MEPDATMVFHGFLGLPNKEKMQIVNAINEYFDSNDRESVRAEHDRRYEELSASGARPKCKCCKN